MSHVSRTSTLAALLASAATFFVVACTGSSTTQVPARGYFAGTWNVTLTLTDPGCPGANPSTVQTRAVTLQQSAGGVLSNDERDPQRRLSGTVTSLTAHLTNADGDVVDLTIQAPSSDSFEGVAVLVDPSGCRDRYSVVATRQSPDACAVLTTGAWDLTIGDGAAAIHLDGGSLSQTVCSARFDLNSDRVVSLTGTLVDRRWSGVYSDDGQLAGLFEVTFAADGSGCEGTIDLSGVMLPLRGAPTPSTPPCDPLSAGTWDMVVSLNGSEVLRFLGCQLTQDSCAVELVYTDVNEEPPTTATWSGTMVGGDWVATGVGRFAYPMTGSFTGGSRFDGTMDLSGLSLGVGTVVATLR